jgi:hypothetical protein
MDTNGINVQIVVIRRMYELGSFTSYMFGSNSILLYPLEGV